VKLFTKIIIGVGIIVIIVALFVLKTLRDAGEFKTLVSHCDCTCTSVKGAAGPEDITVDPELKIAFISSDDRRAAQRGESVQGAIYAYDLESPATPLKNLTPRMIFDFHPHGIYLYRSPKKKLLFVVNHRNDGHFIEIFEFKDMMLHHLESISGPLMTSPNDLIAVGPRQFYVTNDHGATSPLGMKAENYLQLAISYVLYYNGSEFRRAVGDIAYANGIALSNDGKTVYVASPVGRLIQVFDRDKETEALRYRESIDLGTGVDNLDVDENGNIWAGCHPKLLTFVKHQNDPTKIAPSQILKIVPTGKGAYDVKEIYLNTGEELSSSTVAVLYRDRMLIGSVLDDHILDCILNK
jgi:arylesterase/paraoxonase